MAEARRKRAEKAVRIDDTPITDPRVAVPAAESTLTVKLGKRTKLVSIQ